MLTAIVRVKGERDSWWQNMVNLLGGRGIRRVGPEQAAIEAAVGDLRARLPSITPEADQPEISLAISHDGAGVARAATVVAFTIGGGDSSSGSA